MQKEHGEDKRKLQRDFKKEFVSVFSKMCQTRSSWSVWEDVITVMAISIANAVETDQQRRTAREKEYEERIKRLGGMDNAVQLFCILVEALEEKPDQDFLGALFMDLNLGNHWKGQFFTPFHVSKMMAKINLEGTKEAIEQKGWISVCDPCIGAGGMLMAAASVYRENEINYQNHVLFVGQDIDRIAGLMAYIQLSLIGCPGYIAIADTLTNPIVGEPLFPQEQEGQEYWYTPFFYTDVWVFRRKYAGFRMLFQSSLDQIEEKKEEKIEQQESMEEAASSSRIFLKQDVQGQISLFDYVLEKN